MGDRNDEIEARFRAYWLNPPPDSALERALEHGIDPTITFHNMFGLTAEERLDGAGRRIRSAQSIARMRGTQSPRAARRVSGENAITEVLDLFDREGIEYVVIGGAAVILHGSGYVTEDVDLCCRRTPENLAAVARALNSVAPRLRVQGVIDGSPTTVDVLTLQARETFEFITAIGNVDVRFSLGGIGTYDQVAALARWMTIDERRFQLLSLDGIIQSKTFRREPRDLLIIPELEMMREAQHVHDRAEDLRSGPDPHAQGMQPDQP